MSPARVRLRPPAPADRDEFIAAMRASRRLHGRWMSAPETPAAFDALLRRVQDELFEPLLACRLEDGAIVGFFNLSWIIRGPLQSAFLGYGAVAAYAGQGYMTEGMQLLLRYAFTELRLHRVEANIQPGNDASIALARRCGFQCEGFSPKYLKVGGRWCDHERWAITVERWRAMRAGAGSEGSRRGSGAARPGAGAYSSGGPIVAASGPKLST
jgi:[ribosomal protein S5]-alanine N-acetyltransferase